MEIATLQAEAREANGTRAARRLRKTGKLPAVVYGHKQTPVSVAVNAHDLELLLEHGAHILKLNVGGKDEHVLIKAVQFDHLGETPVHADFTLVNLSERIEISVPLEFVGTPAGVEEGGVPDYPEVDIQIECTATTIPSSIRVNIAKLGIGDSLQASDVKLPEGVTLAMPEETVICAVHAQTIEEEPEEEAVEGEEAEEPEIIGRKDKEEEEGESQE
jgi:large subunit ribosomal protein L25